MPSSAVVDRLVGVLLPLGSGGLSKFVCRVLLRDAFISLVTRLVYTFSQAGCIPVEVAVAAAVQS